MQYGHCGSAAVIDTRTCSYLVSEAKVRSLDNVQIFENVVEQVFSGGFGLNFLNQLLLVEEDDFEVK